MDEELTATVRRFNRTVTQRAGALDDEYLARGRPLGQARLLWEIGPAGAEVAALRARLGLDAGHLSRLLRALETDGLVEVTQADGDGRVRDAALTAAGQSEWAILDRESDELAASILLPLSEAQRTRLAGAMAEVERLLVASMVTIEAVSPTDPRARTCLRAYARELSQRFGTTFDPGLTLPHGAFLLATLRDEPVGCGVLHLEPDAAGTPDAPAEIKRLWVSAKVRGLGLGRRLLRELEDEAVTRGRHRVRLDTNHALTEALRLYRSSGYREIPAYNDNPYAHHWFAKDL